MNIIKTTDYFNITVEEAGKKINEYDTREEAKVLDAGLEHYFFQTLEGLEKNTIQRKERAIQIQKVMKFCYLSLWRIIAIITNIVWYSDRNESCIL